MEGGSKERLIQRLERDLVQEARSSRKHKQLYVTLLREYEDTRLQLAEARLHIDRLRFGANVNINRHYVINHTRGPGDSSGLGDYSSHNMLTGYPLTPSASPMSPPIDSGVEKQDGATQSYSVASLVNDMNSKAKESSVNAPLPPMEIVADDLTNSNSVLGHDHCNSSYLSKDIGFSSTSVDNENRELSAIELQSRSADDPNMTGSQLDTETSLLVGSTSSAITPISNSDTAGPSDVVSDQFLFIHQTATSLNTEDGCIWLNQELSSPSSCVQVSVSACSERVSSLHKRISTLMTDVQTNGKSIDFLHSELLTIQKEHAELARCVSQIIESGDKEEKSALQNEFGKLGDQLAKLNKYLKQRMNNTTSTNTTCPRPKRAGLKVRNPLTDSDLDSRETLDTDLDRRETLDADLDGLNSSTSDSGENMLSYSSKMNFSVMETPNKANNVSENSTHRQTCKQSSHLGTRKMFPSVNVAKAIDHLSPYSSICTPPSLQSNEHCTVSSSPFPQRARLSRIPLPVSSTKQPRGAPASTTSGGHFTSSSPNVKKDIVSLTSAGSLNSTSQTPSMVCNTSAPKRVLRPDKSKVDCLQNGTNKFNESVMSSDVDGMVDSLQSHSPSVISFPSSTMSSNHASSDDKKSPYSNACLLSLGTTDVAHVDSHPAPVAPIHPAADSLGSTCSPQSCGSQKKVTSCYDCQTADSRSEKNDEDLNRQSSSILEYSISSESVKSSVLPQSNNKKYFTNGEKINSQHSKNKVQHETAPPALLNCSYTSSACQPRSLSKSGTDSASSNYNSTPRSENYVPLRNSNTEYGEGGSLARNTDTISMQSHGKASERSDMHYMTQDKPHPSSQHKTLATKLQALGKQVAIPKEVSAGNHQPPLSQNALPMKQPQTSQSTTFSADNQLPNSENHGSHQNSTSQGTLPTDYHSPTLIPRGFQHSTSELLAPGRSHHHLSMGGAPSGDHPSHRREGVLPVLISRGFPTSEHVPSESHQLVTSECTPPVNHQLHISESIASGSLQLPMSQSTPVSNYQVSTTHSEHGQLPVSERDQLPASEYGSPKNYQPMNVLKSASSRDHQLPNREGNPSGSHQFPYTSQGMSPVGYQPPTMNHVPSGSHQSLSLEGVPTGDHQVPRGEGNPSRSDQLSAPQGIHPKNYQPPTSNYALPRANNENITSRSVPLGDHCFPTGEGNPSGSHQFPYTSQGMSPVGYQPPTMNHVRPGNNQSLSLEDVPIGDHRVPRGEGNPSRGDQLSAPQGIHPKNYQPPTSNYALPRANNENITSRSVPLGDHCFPTGEGNPSGSHQFPYTSQGMSPVGYQPPTMNHVRPGNNQSLSLEDVPIGDHRVPRGEGNPSRGDQLSAPQGIHPKNYQPPTSNYALPRANNENITSRSVPLGDHCFPTGEGNPSGSHQFPYTSQGMSPVGYQPPTMNHVRPGNNQSLSLEDVPIGDHRVPRGEGNPSRGDQLSASQGIHPKNYHPPTSNDALPRANNEHITSRSVPLGDHCFPTGEGNPSGSHQLPLPQGMSPVGYQPPTMNHVCPGNNQSLSLEDVPIGDHRVPRGEGNPSRGDQLSASQGIHPKNYHPPTSNYALPRANNEHITLRSVPLGDHCFPTGEGNPSGSHQLPLPQGMSPVGYQFSALNHVRPGSNQPLEDIPTTYHQLSTGEHVPSRGDKCPMSQGINIPHKGYQQLNNYVTPRSNQPFTLKNTPAVYQLPKEDDSSETHRFPMSQGTPPMGYQPHQVPTGNKPPFTWEGNHYLSSGEGISSGSGGYQPHIPQDTTVRPDLPTSDATPSWGHNLPMPNNLLPTSNWPPLLEEDHHHLSTSENITHHQDNQEAASQKPNINSPLHNQLSMSHGIPHAAATNRECSQFCKTPSMPGTSPTGQGNVSHLQASHVVPSIPVRISSQIVHPVIQQTSPPQVVPELSRMPLETQRILPTSTHSCNKAPPLVTGQCISDNDHYQPLAVKDQTVYNHNHPSPSVPKVYFVDKHGWPSLSLPQHRDKTVPHETPHLLNPVCSCSEGSCSSRHSQHLQDNDHLTTSVVVDKVDSYRDASGLKNISQHAIPGSNCIHQLHCCSRGTPNKVTSSSRKYSQNAFPLSTQENEYTLNCNNGLPHFYHKLSPIRNHSLSRMQERSPVNSELLGSCTCYRGAWRPQDAETSPENFSVPTDIQDLQPFYNTCHVCHRGCDNNIHCHHQHPISVEHPRRSCHLQYGTVARDPAADKVQPSIPAEHGGVRNKQNLPDLRVSKVEHSTESTLQETEKEAGQKNAKNSYEMLRLALSLKMRSQRLNSIMKRDIDELNFLVK